jgi:hypothetical protein
VFEDLGRVEPLHRERADRHQEPGDIRGGDDGDDLETSELIVPGLARQDAAERLEDLRAKLSRLAPGVLAGTTLRRLARIDAVLGMDLGAEGTQEPPGRLSRWHGLALFGEKTGGPWAPFVRTLLDER